MQCDLGAWRNYCIFKFCVTRLLSCLARGKSEPYPWIHGLSSFSSMLSCKGQEFGEESSNKETKQEEVEDFKFSLSFCCLWEVSKGVMCGINK